MDDNELDKLFGEASAAAEESSKEGASDSDAAEKSAGDNVFVVKQYEGSEEEEDGGTDEDQDEDAVKSDGFGEEDAGEDESSESGEDEEDTEDEEEAQEDGEHKKAPPGKPVPRKRPKPKRTIREAIPLSRRGITVICLAIAIITVILLILFLPAFRVRNAHVEGNVVMTDQQVLRELKLEYNAHLMGGVSGNILDIIRLDYGKTEERIKKENPYIEDIRVSVKLPSTVDVQIKERQKVCYIRTPDGYAALDKDGIVLELTSFDAKKSVRPVICGLNVTYAELGKPVKITNMNDYKKAVIVLGAILAADNASIGDTYSMFENTVEVRMLPSGYMFLTVYSPKGKLIQIKFDSMEKISDKTAWLLYAFNSDALDAPKTKGFLDMTGDDPTLREYE
ncbi:MAG: FtsQ-type POTRA domain-containing protein [Clostridiales bacterium]|nr:FtsQ-type POTRA domain-containing protein [Clostridiales bacterium]